VQRYDESSDQYVQVPALQVVPDSAGQYHAACLACGHEWPTGQLEHLARVIGCSSPDVP
jgi:hypothetical protein